MPLRQRSRLEPVEEMQEDLAQKQAASDYAGRLAEFQDIEEAFRVALDKICANIAELAASAAQVDARRRELAAQCGRLRAKGVYAERPKVSGQGERTVLEATRTGQRAAIAAIGATAKERAGRT